MTSAEENPSDTAPTDMSNLLRALYLSKARPGLADTDIRDILETSRRNNAKLGITGVLCGGKHDFIQVLEGPEHNLIRLYGKIIDDPRHSDCALISIAPIDTRMFKDWSMGYVQNAQDSMESCRLLLSYRLTNDCRDQIIAIMKRFLKLVEP